MHVRDFSVAIGHGVGSVAERRPVILRVADNFAVDRGFDDACPQSGHGREPGRRAKMGAAAR